MKHRLVGISIMVALVAAPYEGAAGTAAPPDRPNILLIVTDDQRDAGYRTMPQMMEWFGRGGTRYDRAFASTPLCCPSRASILSGRYAHNHGVKSNDGSDPLDHSATLTRYLHDGGYTTAFFGKFINGWKVEQGPPHFDRYALLKQGGGYYDNMWNIDGVLQSVDSYSTNFIQHEAQRFIAGAESDDDKPWFAYVAPFAPHAPFIAEERYKEIDIPFWYGTPSVREEGYEDKPPWLRERACGIRCGRNRRARQLRMLASVDDMVAGIREALEANGETNTIAIYMSDNGMMWGDHGRKGKGQPYLTSSRIPFFVRWPGMVAAGERVSDLVLNIDVAPTLVDVAGVRLPPHAPPFDGKSLLPSGPRDRVLLEHWCSLKGCDHYASTTTSAYQYIERYDAEGSVIFSEYYDLAQDPWQLSNVLADGVPENDPDVTALHNQLEADRSCIGSNCP